MQVGLPNIVVAKCCFVCLLAVLSGCSEPSSSLNPESAAPDMYMSQEANDEPNAIKLQHCLIAFRGTKSSKPAERTQEEAKELAEEILAKAKAGEDFGTLVENFTDDSPPGIYQMVNHGLSGTNNPMLAAEQKIYERGSMVKAFGDVGFRLEIGEVDLAPYDKVASPYGYHIIKRIE